jgi:hypothetical protein
VPLLVVDRSSRGWQASFLHALDALMRTENADRVTVVIPGGPVEVATGRPPDLAATSSLQSALSRRPGVTVRRLRD